MPCYLEGSVNVWFGKVPSESYKNEKGKPIPTFWKFKFQKKNEAEQFYALVNVFAELGKHVNENIAPTKLFHNAILAPASTPLTKKIETSITSTPGSTNLLSSDSDDDDDTFTHEDDDNKKSFSGNFCSDSSAGFSSPLFAESQEVVPALHSMYLSSATKKHKKETGVYDFSDDSSTEFGSPIFAKSQNVTATLPRMHTPIANNDYDSSEAFSSMT